MHAHSATISGHVRTYVCTPEAFWSVDLDIYIYLKFQ